MGRVDLHIHSVYSDGDHEPSELIEMAKEKNITTMAITDHDNIDGSKELMKYKNNGIYLYSGVELTALVDRGRMHVLGYNIDLDNLKLNKRLTEMKENSIYNIMLYIEVLKKDYLVNIPDNMIWEMLKKEGNIGRPQLAFLLIELGYCSSVDEAFNKYLITANEKVRKLKKGLCKEECVDLILDAGGIVSLAHPVSLKMSYDEQEKEICYLKNLGMQAIEVIHINNNKQEREFLMEMASKYDLMITGGTDFHGLREKPDVMLGTGINGNVDIREGELTLTKNIKSRYM